MQLNRKMYIFIIIVLTLVSIKYIQHIDKSKGSISDYVLYPTPKYITYGTGGDSPGFVKTITGENLYIQALEKENNKILGYVDEESYMIQGIKISDKLESVSYFPVDNILYTFGKDKPVNIMFTAPATESGDPYESPLYIGYYDGTCEYPAEFDYVRSKKKCSQYLQDTLGFVGYNTVDEMLEDAFGEYITKDDNVEVKTKNKVGDEMVNEYVDSLSVIPDYYDSYLNLIRDNLLGGYFDAWDGIYE